MQILNDEMLEQVAGGATSVEYGMTAALVSVAKIVSIAASKLKLAAASINPKK